MGLSKYERPQSDQFKYWAICRTNNRYILAADASKADGPFYCHRTLKELILKRGKNKVAHFAYKNDFYEQESQLHFQCKETLCAYLKQCLPTGNWATERPLKKDSSKGYKALRPDISGRINGQAVVIEVQASFLSNEQISQRSYEYAIRGAAILWVLPLPSIFTESTYQPRQYEKFLHAMYFGRVYYWCEQWGNKLQAMHFAKAQRYIEKRTWMAKGRIEKSGGGYYKTYANIKSLVPGKKLDITTDFTCLKRKSYRFEDGLQIPACLIYQDQTEAWW